MTRRGEAASATLLSAAFKRMAAALVAVAVAVARRKTPFVTEGRARTRSPEGGRFDHVTIGLHWLTVMLLLMQFTTVWLWGRDADDAPALLSTHQAFGMTIWIVTVVRFVWRHSFACLPPFPAAMPKYQQRLAKVNEYGLYALLLVQPLSGLAITLCRGRPFSLLGWQVPVLAPNHGMSHMLHEIHQFGVTVLLGLVTLHAAAALFHALILRDGIIQRMLPDFVAQRALAPGDRFDDRRAPQTVPYRARGAEVRSPYRGYRDR